MNYKDHLIFKTFFEKYRPLSSYRFPTFKLVLTHLLNNFKNPKILETGCIRFFEDYGAGYSSHIFADFLHNYGGTLTTVDNDEKKLGWAEKQLKPLNEKNNISYVVSDGLEFCQKTEETYNLCYIDTHDSDLNEVGLAIAQKNLESQVNAIKDKITENGIIVVNDADMARQGKSYSAQVYMLKNGFQCIYLDQQSVWKKS